MGEGTREGRAGALFTPIDLGPLTLENRLVVPAMVTRLAGEDGYVNRDITDRYVRFALGRPGLIVVEAMAVHTAKSGPLLRVCDDSFLPGLRALRAACAAVSPSRVVPQIIHFLKVARSGWRQTVDALSPADLRVIIESYAAAARRAREAGFDGVELHMAHAYTLSSFLSRLNPRKDDYGGSLENRLRLPSEVFAAVRREVGRDFAVGVRFVADECVKNGYTEVEAALIAERFARLGADYVSLSTGGKFEDAIKKEGEPLYPYTGYSGDRCMPGAAYPPGANLAAAAYVRRHLRAQGLTTPLCAAGKIGTREVAQAAVEGGTCDLVAMARALLADPDLPKKWAEGRESEVVRCLYGNVCKALDESFRRVTCTLWPKGSLQAPLPAGGATELAPAGSFFAEYRRGRVSLRWGDPPGEAPYGYDVLRAEGGSVLVPYATVRGRSQRYDDTRVLDGRHYRYALRAYDLTGRRAPPTPALDVEVPAFGEDEPRARAARPSIDDQAPSDASAGAAPSATDDERPAAAPRAATDDEQGAAAPRAATDDERRAAAPREPAARPRGDR